jgi:hypothetical protein
VSRRAPIVFTGENPDLILYDEANEMIVAASYWRCTYSKFGQGNVLVLWLRDGVKEIYTDNPGLAKMARVLTSYFEGFQGLEVPIFPIKPAQFFQKMDGKTFYQITCITEEIPIELTWQTFRDVYSINDVFHFGKDFEISFVVCTCERARVLVSGEEISGKVKWSDKNPASSAFLALAESWTLV